MVKSKDIKKDILKRGKDDESCCNMEGCCGGCSKRKSSCGGVYGVGFVGAAIYYISISTGFWMGVLGFLKAMVWPAFLVYEALKYLSAA